MERVTYAGMFRAVAAARRDAPALSFIDRSLSYGELLDGGTRRARELRALGIGRGDRFGVLLPNCPELIELFLGGAMIGAAMVPINTRFKAVELAHVCADAEIGALFTTDAIDEHADLKSLLWEALPGLREAPDPARLELPTAPRLRAVAMVSPHPVPGMLAAGPLADLGRAQPAPTTDDLPAPEDPLLVMYTSGTTANPKGCIETNQGVVRNTDDIAAIFRIEPEDRWWDPLPMFHMGALLLMTATFHRGAEFISQGHFDPGEAIDLFERHRPTVLYPLFPTITLGLIHHPRFAAAPLDQVRAVGSVSPPDVQRQIQDAFPGATLISAYGMTELCGTLAYSHFEDTLEQRLTTCGHLLPNWEARIVAPETNAAVGAGVEGELVVRGPYIFAGYYGDPEATAAAFDAEGWFHTGDRCSLDGDGLLLFHGRLKDMLKVGGENVSALE
ncbi:MAG TPA: class I adenylate-forming enzyme family protein, partial [Solirubrobacterales bacterium]|nr:class I adenylate-forming enzyme family protein [Solirubrobacterales bacterium]